MKNVNKDMLEKCICITLDEFIRVIRETLGNNVCVEANWDGVSIGTDEDCIDHEEVCAALAQYFGVKEVTTYHMDDWEYGYIWICYKGEDATVATAIEQTLSSDDVNERCEQFAEAFFDSIDTDDEPRDRCGRYMLKAIAENSVDDLLIAICGWSAASLMKKANIMRDTDGMFHEKIVDATFVSIWNGERNEVKTDCKVNTETFEVFDIKEPPRIIKGMEMDDATLDGEYVELGDVRYPVTRKEQLPDGNITSFWRK